MAAGCVYLGVLLARAHRARDEARAALDRARRDAQAQDDARNSDRSLSEAILNALPDAVFLLDRNRKVMAQNASARRLFPDLPVEEDIALRFRAPALAEGFDALAQGQDANEWPWTLAGDAPRHYKARLLRVDPSVPGRAFAILTLYDETQARAIEQMRVDFVANASHELRTPLASLLGFIETLMGPARDDAQAREQFLVIMQEQAQRMARLIRDLLSLSRIEMMAYRQPDAKVDLAALIASVREALGPAAQAKGLAIEVRLPSQPIFLRGDHDELTQLFTNLLDNAIKYTRPQTRITLSGERREDMATISVRDEGEGIDPEHLPRLTERFYRVDAARSRAMGGTGLGLAIVKHIVQRHRGRLRIESEKGVGSSFTVSLPLYL